jgi:K+/H+ antiporter YhaU regulatory subunit KhtT
MSNSDSMNISVENSIYLMDTIRGKMRVIGSESTLHQHNSNWNQDAILALINCRHKEHNAFKQILGLILTTQRWTKISKEWQIIE